MIDGKLMPKTAKLFLEMATYLAEDDYKWFIDSFELKNPDLFFTFDKNILVVRNKNTGVVVRKFRVESLEAVDDDFLNDKIDTEDEEETLEQADDALSKSDSNISNSQLNNLTTMANNSEQLKAAGMGDLGDKAKSTLNTYKQAMTGLLNKATETAKKIAGDNR